MKRMEPVSILFADIVGFTKMSANKSAPALVGLLNDLFGRFDRLCELTGCEKISTLGDCYYCVAGCPEPRPDHAYCCVEMGLGMIQAIEQFCQETCETVNMRVGVHTGTVLCGILGMKRFNLMCATAKFLDDRYIREDGRVAERAGQIAVEKLKGVKTYLISGRKLEHEVQYGCSQVGLSSGDFASFNLLSRSQCHPDIIPGAQANDPLALHQLSDRTGPVSRGVVLSSAADLCDEAAVLNGGKDDHKTPSAKFLPGHSPRALNGLLSPPLEDAVRASQSSLCDMLQEKEKKTSSSTGTGTSLAMAAGPGATGTGMDHSALIQLRAKNFREKSDAHFVDVIREDSLMKDYFFKPPINKISLNFLERPLETAYRSSYKEEVKNMVRVQTFASSTFSSFLDVLLSCFFFLALTLVCFLPALVTSGPLSLAALALTPLAGLLELLSLVLSIRMAFHLEEVMSCTHSLLLAVSGWMPRHVVGAVLVSLPAVSVLSHFTPRLPLQVTQSYSKNHDSVGVIFASIVNFSEFYEESYEGGKECYRVLNELIGDFDELLRKPEFKSVEKIKTIGATYMAASGLNVQQMAENEDDCPHTHLMALFNFAIEMIKVLDDFNKNMLGFGFKLRIGYNHGPLTAGVIGTTKLLYDIWGDTVNIASRMDSTGVECRVQVSEESHTILSSMGLEFDYRGTVNVKGKGQMRTFLYPKSGETLCKHISGTYVSHGPCCVSSKITLPSTTSVCPPLHLSEKPKPVLDKTKEWGDEGYRDSSQPSGETETSNSGLEQESNATELPSQQHTSLSATLQHEEEDEEVASELTKLNEEFYARL
ncbi:hypothetical protein WMY93_006535 [Mugilogobius chulae]|uniref:adenylate cyclase n=1 Tax=Mugilogobius chulae TaxID=88201 RepID=A0AAW0PK71_9GOBI